MKSRTYRLIAYIVIVTQFTMGCATTALVEQANLNAQKKIYYVSKISNVFRTGSAELVVCIDIVKPQINNPQISNPQPNNLLQKKSFIIDLHNTSRIHNNTIITEDYGELHYLSFLPTNGDLVDGCNAGGHQLAIRRLQGKQIISDMQHGPGLMLEENENEMVVVIRDQHNHPTALYYVSKTPITKGTNTLYIPLQHSFDYSEKNPSILVLLPVTIALDATVIIFYVIGKGLTN